MTTVNSSSLLRQALAEDRPQEGVLQFVAGRGPADLLTLRASRALAAADVLGTPQDADAEVLGMARRDAERLPAADAGTDRLIELAREGLRVVVVITAPPAAEDIQAFARSGVRVEVMLAAPEM